MHTTLEDTPLLAAAMQNAACCGCCNHQKMFSTYCGQSQDVQPCQTQQTLSDSNVHSCGDTNITLEDNATARLSVGNELLYVRCGATSTIRHHCRR
jgi:hypothetical protein